MFIGHFAPALIASTHKDAPRLPVLMVAAQLVDWAFFGLLLTGAEAMRITPGISVMNPMDLYHMPWTHSLLGALAFGVGLAVIIWALARGAGNGTTILAWPKQLVTDGNDVTVVVWPRLARDGNGNTIVVWTKRDGGGNGITVVVWAARAAVAGLIAGAVVVSHWFLDLLVHVPDLTLAGNPPNFGLGLWNYPMIEIPIELGITFGALWYWVKQTGRRGAGLWALAATMLALQLFNWFGPVDTAVTAMTSFTALFAFGLITLASWWAERGTVEALERDA